MPDYPRSLLVFEHIPKTAGSTMHGILWSLYGNAQVYFSTHRHRHPEYMEALTKRLQNPSHSLKVIVSHTGFGFHERLPGSYHYDHFTFLRNPVERVISQYYFQIQRGQLDAATSLETFVREDLGRSCNVQTAFMSGLELKHNLGEITLSRDLYTEALLEKAKAGLHRQTAIGLTERFDESLLLFKKVFGWKSIRLFYVRRRIGWLRRERPPVSEQLLELIRRYNALDLELYRYGRTLYARQLAEHFADGKPDVKTFQRLNAVYGRLYPLARPVVHTARALKKQLSS